MGTPRPKPKFLEVGDEKKFRLPRENPNQEEQRLNPAMERFRDYVVMELATKDPSKLVGNGATRRLRSSVERQFRSIISNFRTPTHPPYSCMIFRAIEKLNEGGGSTTKAISKFIVREYENLPLAHEDILVHHLGKLCKTGDVHRMNDDRYILRVDGSAVKRGVVAVESKNRKKQRGRKTGVSRSRGVQDTVREETKGGEIGEENHSIEQEMEGQIEWQEMHMDRIDDEKEWEEEGERGEVLDQINEEKNEAVKEQSEAERQNKEVAEQEMGIVIDRIDDEKKGEEEQEEALDQRNEEKNEAGKEQSDAERQETEITEEQIQMRSRTLNDDGGSNGDEIVQAFIKAKAKVSENKVYIEAGEQQHGKVKEHLLEISAEQNEPQSEQTDVQKEQQQDKAKLNSKISLASPLNEQNFEFGGLHTDVIEEQQLGISTLQKVIHPQQAEIMEEKIQLEEVQKQHQQESFGQEVTTNVKHDTISASAPAATAPLVWPSSDTQQANLEKQSEVPIMPLLPKSKSAKKKFLPQQEHNQGLLPRRKLRSYTRSNVPESATSSSILEPSLPEHNQGSLQRRKLRSYTQSNVPKSAMSSTILEPSSLSQQHELQKQALHEGPENQDQWRHPKEKRDEKRNVKTESPLGFHPHHDEQPLKCHQVQERHAKPTPDADAIKEAYNVQVQDEEHQHNQVQLQQRILGSPNKEHSVAESPITTMTPSSMPPKPTADEDAIKEASDFQLQNEDQQQNQAQLQKRVLRSHYKKYSNSAPAESIPPKPTPDADAIKKASDVQVQNEQQQHNQVKLQQRALRSHNKEPSIIEPAEPTMSSVSSKNQVKQQQQGRRQGRSPMPRIDAERNLVCALPSASQQGRSPKPQIDADTNVVCALPAPSQQGRSPKPQIDTDKSIVPALPSPSQQGRSPKPQIATDTNVGCALPSASKHHEEAKRPRKQHERGRHHKLKAATTGSALSSALQDHNGEGVKPLKPSGQKRPRNQKTAKEHSEEEQKPPKCRRLGRPPLPIPSKYMLMKYGKLQLPVRGRGRPPKAKQDAKSTLDVTLTTNTHLKKPKQKHRKGRGRPPKAE